MTLEDCRLLILDDEPMIGGLLQAMATGFGAQGLHTTAHQEFFRLLKDWHPSHIVLDLNMPDMDGVEVMLELARLDCQARIIITSGIGARVLDAAKRSASAHGLNIVGVLAKPFRVGDLRALLTREAPGENTQRMRVAMNPNPGHSGGAELEPADLEKALERNEIHMAFQPKVWCADGRLAGFEALVRWTHPAWGLQRPDQFIPLAENSDLIVPLTERVIDLSLDWFARWSPAARAGADPARAAELAEKTTLSINLSARNLGQHELANQVLARCDRLGISPQRVIFELTETGTMDDPVAALDLLTRLRTRGFQLSIDDFGTGFSSMVQLVRLPFSEIKVDKSFVMTAASSAESRTVIKSVVDLAHSLGLRSTAEGIENAAGFDYVRDIGCDLAQGYHIARPMPGDAAIEWGIGYSPSRSPAAMRS